MGKVIVGGKWNPVTPGEKFGTLTAVSRVPGKGISRWQCLCDCGVEIVAIGTQLRSGIKKTCGCTRRRSAHTAPATLASRAATAERMGKFLGRKFGRLTVVEEGPKTVRCVCDCGGETSAMRSKLKRGEKQSCGCLQSELASHRLSERARLRRISEGLPEEAKPPKRSPESRRLRVRVLKRDGNRCVLCNTHAEKMVVHHIESWKLREDLRIEMTNLVSLCTPCHTTKAHSATIEPPTPETALVLKDYIRSIYPEKYPVEKNGRIYLTPEEVSSTLAGVVPDRVRLTWGEISPQECLQLATNTDTLTVTNNELDEANTDGRN